MITRLVTLAALSALTACSTSIPDSNPNARSGVGFGTPDQFAQQRAARDRELETGISAIPEERAIASETLDVLNATGTTATAAAPAAGTELVANNPSISDEQNFDAVSSRETIESDRQRIERQRAAMEVATPQAVPTRPRGTGPNIVSFALSTSNPVGQQVYSRSGRFNEESYRRACAKYGSSDQAQAAFLDAGGPERDRRGLDPDGDGYACFWDPTPFRNARG